MKKKIFLTTLFAFVLLLAAACGGKGGQSTSSQEEYDQSSELAFSSSEGEESSPIVEESSSIGEDVGENSVSQSFAPESSEEIFSVEQSSEIIESSEMVESSEPLESIESSKEVESSEEKESSPELSEGYFWVMFDSAGGTAVESVSVKEGEKISKPKDPQKSTDKYTYEFVGWYFGDIAWDFEKHVVTENITLVAKWKKDSTNILFPPKN